MTSETSIRNDFCSRHIYVVVLLLLLAVSGLTSVSAQDTQSQRRLSAGEGPQGPIEQIRLLMQLQHLQSQFQPPDAPTRRSEKNSLAERLRNRKGIPKKNGVTPDNAFPTPQENTPRVPTKTQRDLQRLREQLGQLLPGPTAPDAETSSQLEVPRGEEIGKLKRHRTRNGSLNRTRSRPSGARSQPPAPSDKPFYSNNDLLQEIVRNNPDLLTSPEFAQKIIELSKRQSNNRSDTTDNSISAFNISKELSRNGLSKTVSQLVRDIQTKVQREQGAESERGDGSAKENSTLNQTLFRVLDAVREEVVDTVRKSRKDQQDRSARRGQKSTVTENRSGQSSDHANNSASPGKPEPTLTTPPQASSTQGSPFNPLSNLPDWGSSFDDSTSTQLFIILFGLGTAVGIYFLITQRKRLAQSQSQSDRLNAVRPENIRTREDVIRAFHWLTHCQSPDAANWWNHLQATESLSQHSIGRDQSLQELVSLYEAARYQSADREFDQAQVQQARSALAGCLS